MGNHCCEREDLKQDMVQIEHKTSESKEYQNEKLYLKPEVLRGPNETKNVIVIPAECIDAEQENKNDDNNKFKDSPNMNQLLRTPGFQATDFSNIKKTNSNYDNIHPVSDF